MERYSYVVNRYPESPFAPKSQHKIAVIYDRDLNDPEKAVYSYSAFFFMYPGSPEEPEAREELAGLYSRNGEYRLALEEYQRLYEAQPEKRQKFQYLIAMEYIKMNDFRQARVELVELNNIVTNPGVSPRIRLHIANTYYIEGRNREALERYDDVISRFPQNEAAKEAMMQKAKIYEEEGRTALAMKALVALEADGDASLRPMVERLRKRLDARAAREMR